MLVLDYAATLVCVLSIGVLAGLTIAAKIEGRNFWYGYFAIAFNIAIGIDNALRVLDALKAIEALR